MRPLRDLAAEPTTVLIETRTAAQASRDAVTLYPDMKVLSVARAGASARAKPTGEVVVRLARAAGDR